MVTLKVGNWSLGFGSKKDEQRKRPLALVILDGWGYSGNQEGNAIALAHTPNYDQLCIDYPQTVLSASGARVGLTPEDPGNSEVGHLSLGTGRVVKSPRTRILNAIDSGEFFQNAELKKAFAHAREKKSKVHLIGLLSDGNVHSSMDSLFSLLRMSRDEGVGENTFIHGILDGKDVDKHTADIYVEAIEIKLADIGCGKIATLCGRHYAMDKSENWARTARAYTMLTHSEGERAFDPVTAIRGSFLRGNSDEFVQPIVLESKPGIPMAKVADDDVVIFFNHRADRMQQLVKSLCMSETYDFAASGKPKIRTVCLTQYHPEFNLPVAFRSSEESNVLGKVFADNGVLNCRLTESEKYDHVTYFFNGGAEKEYPGEKRILIQPKESTNGNAPEMGCFKVTDKLLRGLEAGENDVFIVNLAAADILAHTGDLDKTIEAVQFIDTCLGGILKKIHEIDGVALITSDHGNCEQMSNGSANSSTANPVPFHLVANNLNGTKLRKDGALEDVAPTILGILGIDKPKEMTGNDLRTE